MDLIHIYQRTRKMNLTLTLNRVDDFNIFTISKNDIKETKALLSSVYTPSLNYRNRMV